MFLRPFGLYCSSQYCSVFFLNYVPTVGVVTIVTTTTATPTPTLVITQIKHPTRCNSPKIYCFVVQTLLNMFRALQCPSSGARQTAVAASGFRMNVQVEVFSAVVG